MEQDIDLIHIEVIRIEMGTGPPAHFSATRMRRVSVRRKELRVSRDAPDILRRAASPTACAPHDAGSPLVGLDLFQRYLVLPPVAEVVLVYEVFTLSAQNCFEANSSFIRNAVAKLWIWLPEAGRSTVELMQMRIQPAHCDLKSLVQIGKGH